MHKIKWHSQILTSNQNEKLIPITKIHKHWKYDEFIFALNGDREQKNECEVMPMINDKRIGCLNIMN